MENHVHFLSGASVRSGAGREEPGPKLDQGLRCLLGEDQGFVLPAWGTHLQPRDSEPPLHCSTADADQPRLPGSQKPRPSRGHLLLASKVPVEEAQRHLGYQVTGVAAAFGSTAPALHKVVRPQEQQEQATL